MELASILAFLATLTYAISPVVTGKLAHESLAELSAGKQLKGYPTEYYTWLLPQLAVVIWAATMKGDEMLAVSRIFLFIVVGFVLTCFKDEDGVLTWINRHTRLMYYVATSFFVLMVCTLKFSEHFMTYSLVLVLVDWLPVIAVLLYVVFGQGPTVRSIWNKRRSREPAPKGKLLQAIRATGFSLFALSYLLSGDAFLLAVNAIPGVIAWTMLALYMTWPKTT